MKLIKPKKHRCNTRDEENSATTYLSWLREFLTAAGGSVDADGLEEEFLEKFGSTFSAADHAKWRNTLAWAVVASRSENVEAAMSRAGLPSDGAVYLARIKVKGKRKHARFYVIDTAESELLQIAYEQLNARQTKSINRKKRLAPDLDPKRPWFRCPRCESWTYFGARQCVRCFAVLPKNPRTKVFRR